ncbi:MAG: hypothetical protein SFT94_09600 [Pseudanabaenaceae cyanobacterium bins.68]|nr:hypothetical protein [Pseudanabaenaceae cyanobacterium bins.68]
MKYLSLNLLATGGILAITCPAIAQVTPKPVTESQQALQELRQENSGDLFRSNGTTGIMQLIHNANLLNGKSPEQVRSQQAESIDQSVQQFRQRQQLNQGQSQGTITKPAPSSTK